MDLEARGLGEWEEGRWGMWKEGSEGGLERITLPQAEAFYSVLLYLSMNS